jgi:hypothetical protein
MVSLPGLVADGSAEPDRILADRGAFTGDSSIAVAIAVSPVVGGRRTPVVPLLYLAGLALIATACVRSALPETAVPAGLRCRGEVRALDRDPRALA